MLREIRIERFELDTEHARAKEPVTRLAKRIATASRQLAERRPEPADEARDEQRFRDVIAAVNIAAARLADGECARVVIDDLELEVVGLRGGWWSRGARFRPFDEPHPLWEARFAFGPRSRRLVALRDV